MSILRKILLVTLLLTLPASLALAQFNPPLQVCESDGSPCSLSTRRINVSNSSLTDNGGGVVTLSSGSGDLLADGSIPLTANWDVGDYGLTAKSFTANITGAADTDLSTPLYAETDSYNLLTLDSYTDTAIVGDILMMRRGRGDTGSKAKVQAGDNIARISGRSYSGSAFEESALISMTVGSSVTDSLPGRIQFWTRNIGAGDTAVELRMTIDEDGEITIPGTFTPTNVNWDNIDNLVDTNVNWAAFPGFDTDLFLRAESDGSVNWEAAGSALSGTDTYVCFYDSTAAACNDAGIVYNKTTDTLTVGSVETTAAGQSVIDEGLVVNNDGGATETHDFVVNTDTVSSALECDAGEDLCYFNVPVKLGERAASAVDLAGYGQIWVKNDAPNTLYFTDDDGTDYDLLTVSLGANEVQSSNVNWTDIETLGPINNASVNWADMTDLATGGAVSWGNIGEGELADASVVDADIKDDTIQEPALNVSNSPTDNYILSYNLAGTNFTWVEDAGGGNFFWVLQPQQAKLPSSNPMRIDAGNARWRGLFEDTTSESATWESVLQPFSGTLKAKIYYSLETTSSSKLVAFDLKIDCFSDADAADFDTASWGTTDSIDSASQSLTAGYIDVLTDTSLNGDSCAEGDIIVVSIARDTTTDDAPDDVELRKVIIYAE